MAFLAAIMVVSCVAAIAVAFVLKPRRPAWSRAKVAAIAALAVPVPLAFPVLWVVVSGVVTQVFRPDRCGADGCAMSVAIGMVALFWLVVSYMLAVAVAWNVWRFVKP